MQGAERLVRAIERFNKRGTQAFLKLIRREGKFMEGYGGKGVETKPEW